MSEDDYEGMEALESMDDDAYMALLDAEESMGLHDPEHVNAWYWGDEPADERGEAG